MHLEACALRADYLSSRWSQCFVGCEWGEAWLADRRPQWRSRMARASSRAGATLAFSIKELAKPRHQHSHLTSHIPFSDSSLALYSSIRYTWNPNYVLQCSARTSFRNARNNPKDTPQAAPQRCHQYPREPPSITPLSKETQVRPLLYPERKEDHSSRRKWLV